MSRPDGRAAGQLRPVVLERQGQSLRGRILPDSHGGDAGALHGQRGARRPGLQEGQRGRVGHGGVLDAPAGHGRADPAGAQWPRRPHAGNPAPHRPFPPCRHGERWPSASIPSASIATSCRPTAEPVPRASPAAASHSPMHAPGCRSAPAFRLHSEHSWRRSRWGSSKARCGCDLAYLEDRDAGVDANIVMRAPGEYVEVQGTGEHGRFSRDELQTLLDYGERAIGELFTIQRAALGW